MTFTELEAKAALDAVEGLLRDMVSGASMVEGVAELAAYINQAQKAGQYPCTGVWLMMHHTRYPESMSFFGLLLFAVIRARAEATKGQVQ